ncbi:MAG: DUF3159 domain-containing protein [Nocardioides sp.]|uniref:DUF3159 domain-containing protein n=1 Tax=Nocardioides nematodiphilus TaxID=2849669 RepID=UPI001CDA2BF5|nr:DUF3159 domain-containing protein [Nocardioides nematodiphilus]MCA1982622.1 DUF3159 domain-containing protein [Nocardioides nematodiphilus]
MTDPATPEPSEHAEPEHPEHHHVGVDTVEAVVRRQMAESLGGRRGMLEAALPGLAFTLVWLVAKDIKLAMIAGIALAGVALLWRLVERTTIQYVANAIVGIGIGWLVVHIARNMGGSQEDQALAFFVPGVVITGVYTVLLVISCLVRWPAIGFMVGSVAGDPLEWHDNRQIVTLCTRLTWLFLAPGAILALVEGVVILLGYGGAMHKDAAVLVLGIIRLGIGWPLRLLAWGGMVWLLARNATPLEG